MGIEERTVISPAIKKAQRRGIRVTGPIPSDVLWYQVKNKTFDVGVAMYHDQGQIPVKLEGEHKGVNITLGLPIIRTSPAHGSAYDIAGKNKASEEGMIEAISTAIQMVKVKSRDK
jgi:4-hydroxythreonine-4-phosphate dehydrogenase